MKDTYRKYCVFAKEVDPTKVNPLDTQPHEVHNTLKKAVERARILAGNVNHDLKVWEIRYDCRKLILPQVSVMELDVVTGEVTGEQG